MVETVLFLLFFKQRTHYLYLKNLPRTFINNKEILLLI